MGDRWFGTFYFRREICAGSEMSELCVNVCYNWIVMRNVFELILTLLSSAIILITGIRWYVNMQVDTKITSIQADLSAVTKEIKVNGGGSIKDQITKVAADVDRLKDQNDENKQDHDMMAAKLDDMYRTLLDYVSRNT